MKIGIVTDSTADLPQALIDQYEIEVVPLQVSIDNQHYRDGVDLSSTQFYQILRQTDSQPTTSQPSIGVFVECYQKLLQKVDAILSIHLTEKFSGTVRAAQMASEVFPQAVIRVMDSQSTSMGLGSIVLESARAVKEGLKLDQITSLIEQWRERVRFLIALDTLEFLRRGGRASKMQTFLSSILQIKPLLEMVHGEIELVAKVRRHSEVVQLMLEKFSAYLAHDSKAIIAIMHTDAEQEAFRLKTILTESFHNAEVILNQAGPVLGTHIGPGTLALICLPKLS